MKSQQHCVKQPDCEMIGIEPVSQVNKTGNVISMPNNRIAQSSKKVTPRKPKNEDRRSRKYLKEEEVVRLRNAAKKVGRLGDRDSLIIRMMYRHGLRVSELCNLRWEQVSFDDKQIHINRVKHGSPSVQPIDGDELRELRKLKKEQSASPFIFLSERKGPLSSRAVQMMIERAGKLAGIEFPVNAHALRHATGYRLANKGIDTRAIQGYLGHRNIQHTVVYTELDPGRYEKIGSILGG